MIAAENKELAELIRQGDKQGYEILYSKYAYTLYGMILRQVNNTEKAEFLLEKSMLKILADIREYDPAHQQFFTWALGITRNILNSMPENAKSESAIPSHEPHSSCPEVVKLVFWNRISIDETARIMNISVSEVKACLRKELKNVAIPTA